MSNFNNHWTNKQVLEFEQFIQNYNIELKKNDLFLFQQAFIHPSYAYENQLDYNYQKLEFYGDALIEKEISSYLFNKNNLTEGQMTLDRIKMVNHNSLTKLAKALHFEKFILVGSSYQLNHISDKNYEDIFEAFCAALYLTNGEIKLKHFLSNTIIKYYENKMLEDNHDYKTKFQEMMQRFGKHEIKYITTETNEQGKHVFNTELKCDNIVYGNGVGNKKHDAENNAAKNALEKCASLN